MLKCPFLSTQEESIECFKECCFNNWSENDGNCPFKEVTNIPKAHFDEDDETEFYKANKSAILEVFFESIKGSYR